MIRYPMRVQVADAESMAIFWAGQFGAGKVAHKHALGAITIWYHEAETFMACNFCVCLSCCRRKEDRKKKEKEPAEKRRA